ncbi:MAG: class I SAM-dependent methyltransferase [Opitutales bacterium]
MQIDVLNQTWPEYALIDSGNRLKYEQFGPIRVIRSEPKAWWNPKLPKAEWEKADATFDDSANKWKRKKGCPFSWKMTYRGITFEAKLTDGSKHLGVFPEQSPHWDFIHEQIEHGPVNSLLNLFGYTGAASLVAAKAGAKVTHLDASKPAIAWGRANQEASDLSELPIRWILDDALKFVQRERRRGRTYDAVCLDPPSFGRGPKNELWKVEDSIVELLNACRAIMGDKPKMLLLTMYNLEASSLMLEALVREVMGKKGDLKIGELALNHNSGTHQLPLSLYARWTA